MGFEGNQTWMSALPYLSILYVNFLWYFLRNYFQLSHSISCWGHSLQYASLCLALCPGITPGGTRVEIGCQGSSPS